MHDAIFTSSSFGGGWIAPANLLGSNALQEFYGEKPYPLAPLGDEPGYIVQPQEVSDLATHMVKARCIVEARP